MQPTMNAARLKPTVKYTIDGLADAEVGIAEYPRWSYNWSISGRARFTGPNSEKKFIELDQLTEIAPGHLRYAGESGG
jgi:hypothetical protein